MIPSTQFRMLFLNNPICRQSKYFKKKKISTRTLYSEWYILHWLVHINKHQVKISSVVLDFAFYLPSIGAADEIR